MNDLPEQIHKQQVQAFIFDLVLGIVATVAAWYYVIQPWLAVYLR